MTNPKEELRDYLKKLILRLLYVKGLSKQLNLLKEWETPTRITALEIGSYFFKLVGFSFYRTLLIELCMLIDDREKRCIVDWLEKAKEHARAIEPSIYNSDKEQRVALNVEEYQQIICEQQELINSKKEIIEKIKGLRDSTLAHSDAKYFNNPEEVYIKFPLSNDDIDIIIETATDILRMQHVYLLKSDLDIQVHAASNIDRVLCYLRAFDRVWRDERTKSLYPYLYKLDNYEELLKEHLLQNEKGKLQ